MKPQRLIITALLLCACAAAALLTAEGRTQARVDDALLTAQTHRFGRTTKSRLGVYLRGQTPGIKLRWSAEPEGLMGPVRLKLEVGDKIYAFSVDGEEIVGVGAETEALLKAVIAADR